MKFNMHDKVRIIKLSETDSNYLLYKTGNIVKITNDNEYPYEILFDDEKARGLGEVLWKDVELEIVHSEETILHLSSLQNDRNISDAFDYLKSKGVTPEMYEKLWKL